MIDTSPRPGARDRRPLLIIGAIALVLWLIGAVLAPRTAFAGYLAAYQFWLSLSLGSLGMLMLHHLVGGRWAALARRPWEAATRLIPILALLFVPIAVGVPFLYAWAAPHAPDALLDWKAPYLNLPFFYVRAVVYFACWWFLAHQLNRASREQDASPSPALQLRLAGLSGVGSVVLGLTASFAAIDWLLSLEPSWYSTIFGMLILLGEACAGTAYACIALGVFRRETPYAEALTPQALNDLGNVLLACVMTWAYLAFSQYLIIWAGNISQEAAWYVHRERNGWSVVGAALAVLHFFAPFLLLLSRQFKRNPVSLAWLGGLVLLAEALHDWWLVLPSFSNTLVLLPWAEGLAFVGLGGLWLWAVHRELFAWPLVPLHSPILEEVAEHAS